jgi:transcriptional regulator with XRE-family HTH domain
MAKSKDDPAMKKVRALFKESGLTLHDLGVKMGYAPENARQAAFQFMKSNDPRISMLRKAAEAFGVGLKDLL